MSGGITGTPAALPTCWTLSGGFLIYGYAPPTCPDITPPQVSATVTGGTPTFGVYGGPVNVVVTGTDEVPGSGVASIHWSSTGAQTAGETIVSGDTATIPVSAVGTTVVTYWAVDGAGNESAHQTETVQIDNRPILSISPVASALEPDTPGTFRAIYFQLTLSKPSASPVVVSYYTEDGTATGCGSGCDYKKYGSLATPTTWTIPAGVTSSTLGGLSVNADGVVEPEETFYVNIPSATNAFVGQGVGQGNIIDADDISQGGKPVLMLTPKNSVVEGDAGNAKAQVIINLSKPLTAPLNVYFSSADLDAIGGAACGTGVDYKTIAPRYVTIAAGNISSTIDIAVCSNTTVEYDRQFQITHTPTAAPPGNQLVDVQAPAIVTIVDDDVPA
ncbi:MAG: Calx-beta domain-containing protein [Acidimicrobiales bacterium]